MATVGPAAIAANPHRMGFSGTAGHRISETWSGHQSVLPFGHSSTENSCQGSVGEKSQTELECSRCVVLISKFRAFARLRARADCSCDGSKPEGLHHKAMRRPEDRRIFTMGQDE
jgi:hypothetical protein